jgi:hypothetical protein
VSTPAAVLSHSSVSSEETLSSEGLTLTDLLALLGDDATHGTGTP